MIARIRLWLLIHGLLIHRWSTLLIYRRSWLLIYRRLFIHRRLRLLVYRRLFIHRRLRLLVYRRLFIHRRLLIYRLLIYRRLVYRMHIYRRSWAWPRCHDAAADERRYEQDDCKFDRWNWSLFLHGYLHYKFIYTIEHELATDSCRVPLSLSV
ncbi:MAG: hypothetical protein M1517_09590 [Deltaproteobacteria bacterium]|nr:hypothetical protein [Deltaproteobacteria bacterium]